MSVSRGRRSSSRARSVERLGDYASVVATLIDTFADVTGHDELSVYRSLTTADRDVIRVRAAESDDGSVTLNAGVHLIGGARDMLLSVACSLREPQPVYRAGAICGRRLTNNDSRSRRFWSARTMTGRLRPTGTGCRLCWSGTSIASASGGGC